MFCKPGTPHKSEIHVTFGAIQITKRLLHKIIKGKPVLVFKGTPRNGLLYERLKLQKNSAKRFLLIEDILGGRIHVGILVNTNVKMTSKINKKHFLNPLAYRYYKSSSYIYKKSKCEVLPVYF
jgi:hypothetical protein